MNFIAVSLCFLFATYIYVEFETVLIHFSQLCRMAQSPETQAGHMVRILSRMGPEGIPPPPVPDRGESASVSCSLPDQIKFHYFSKLVASHVAGFRHCVHIHAASLVLTDLRLKKIVLAEKGAKENWFLGSCHGPAVWWICWSVCIEGPQTPV